MHACPSGFAKAPIGRQRHAANQRLERHCHDEAFATVVLAGGYLEAGDEGRRIVQAGDVLIHLAYESHLDCFSRHGADVLILPVVSRNNVPVFGRVADPEQLLRIADDSPLDAWSVLADTLQPSDQRHCDWPDLLAERLRVDPDLSLRNWAEETGLRPETVSRGFHLAYGGSPKSFRVNARTRAALERIRDSQQPLSDIAAALGFADQAHMSRAVVALTGCTPRFWRQTNAPMTIYPCKP